MDDSHDLDLLLRSRIPLIVAETHEERRVRRLFRERAPTLCHPLFHWSVANGLQREDLDVPAQKHAAEPEQALRQIRATTTPGVYVLADLHPYLQDPVIVRLLREIALDYPRCPHTLVLVSHRIDLPEELRAHTVHFQLQLPARHELEQLVDDLATAWARRTGQRVKTDRRTLERLVDNLRGLPLVDARRLARGAIVDDGAITEADLPELQRAKFRLLDREGALSFEYDTAHMADVGGLRRLKAWLRVRADAFRTPDPHLDPPRGVLLVGVQGAGKSLAAKAVAGVWGLPLLRLDVGALYSKYYGESERNLRNAMKTAEAVAPCILWIDEIEKALSAGDGDNGVSRRLLGTFLTWLAERRGPRAVFVVATANDIGRLPPELIRKGRFDEIFFVDLPREDVRREIFSIHLQRRGQTPQGFDLASLATACAGFSGAEIEQTVVSALYAARAAGRKPTTATLLEEIEATRPLSVVMAESVDRLRSWAESRTVPAD